MYRSMPSPEAPLVVVAAQERVLAYRRADGALAWLHDFRARSHWDGFQDPSTLGPLSLEMTPERVFVATTTHVTAIEYASGRIVGQVTLTEARIRPQMVVDGHDLFVSTDKEIVCLDLGGNVRWRAPHGLEIGASTPAIGVPGNVRQGDFAGYK